MISRPTRRGHRPVPGTTTVALRIGREKACSRAHRHRSCRRRNAMIAPAPAATLAYTIVSAPEECSRSMSIAFRLRFVTAWKSIAVPTLEHSHCKSECTEFQTRIAARNLSTWSSDWSYSGTTSEGARDPTCLRVLAVVGPLVWAAEDLNVLGAGATRDRQDRGSRGLELTRHWWPRVQFRSRGDAT
jgi:hypothetical protein